MSPRAYWSPPSPDSKITVGPADAVSPVQCPENSRPSTVTENGCSSAGSTLVGAEVGVDGPGPSAGSAPLQAPPPRAIANTQRH